MEIAILLFDRITALDAIGPYEVLSRLPGARVRWVARSRGKVGADGGGLQLFAGETFDSVRGADVLLLPGGIGTRALENDATVLGWIRDVHETTRATTSVCTGALLLGAAGLLSGLEATTHWALGERLVRHGARYVPRRVVTAGKIVTAAGVSAGVDMALALSASLCGKDVAEAIQLGIEYDPAPPFDSGSPEKARPEIRDFVLSEVRRREERVMRQ